MGEVTPKGNAEKAGLNANDQILEVNGQEAVYSDQLRTILAEKKGKEVELTVLRDADKLKLPVKVTSDGTIGFAFNLESIKTETQDFTFFQAFCKASKAKAKFLNVLVSAVSNVKVE